MQLPPTNPRNDSMFYTLVYRTWRHCNQISSFQFQAAAWHAHNQSHEQSFPAFRKQSPRISLKSEFYDHKQDLIRIFKEATQIDSIDLLEKYFNELLRRKGSCHGFCMCMLIYILQQPDLNPQYILKRIPILSEQTVSYLQLLEFLRTQSNDTQKFLQELPQPDQTMTFSFEKSPRRVHEQLLEIQQFLSTHYSICCLVRVWNEKQNSAHTLLFRTSRKRHMHFFYNSKRAGLYRYGCQFTLVRQFIRHILATAPKSCKPGGHWVIELFRG